MHIIFPARNTKHLSGRGNVGCDTTEWLNNTSTNNTITNNTCKNNTSTSTNTFAQQEDQVQSDIEFLAEDDENPQTDDLGDLCRCIAFS